MKMNDLGVPPFQETSAQETNSGFDRWNTGIMEMAKSVRASVTKPMTSEKKFEGFMKDILEKSICRFDQFDQFDEMEKHH